MCHFSGCYDNVLTQEPESLTAKVLRWWSWGSRFWGSGFRVQHWGFRV